MNKFLILVLLFFCGCSENSDKPKLTAVEFANQISPVLLPTTATKVRCATDRQTQDFFIRFDCPKDALDSWIKRLIENNNKTRNHDLPFNKVQLSLAPRVSPHPCSPPTPWWNLSLISSGYYRGENDMYSAHIWVDEKLSRVYFHQKIRN